MSRILFENLTLTDRIANLLSVVGEFIAQHY